jgi:hypothetical protein
MVPALLRGKLGSVLGRNGVAECALSAVEGPILLEEIADAVCSISLGPQLEQRAVLTLELLSP